MIKLLQNYLDSFNIVAIALNRISKVRTSVHSACTSPTCRVNKDRHIQEIKQKHLTKTPTPTQLKHLSFWVFDQNPSQSRMVGPLEVNPRYLEFKND